MEPRPPVVLERPTVGGDQVGERNYSPSDAPDSASYSVCHVSNIG